MFRDICLWNDTKKAKLRNNKHIQNSGASAEGQTRGTAETFSGTGHFLLLKVGGAAPRVPFILLLPT